MGTFLHFINNSPLKNTHKNHRLRFLWVFLGLMQCKKVDNIPINIRKINSYGYARLQIYQPWSPSRYFLTVSGAGPPIRLLPSTQVLSEIAS